MGNQNGSVGIGQGKSKQVPDAIKKATEVTKEILIQIPLKKKEELFTMMLKEKMVQGKF